MLVEDAFSIYYRFIGETVDILAGTHLVYSLGYVSVKKLHGLKCHFAKKMLCNARFSSRTQLTRFL